MNSSVGSAGITPEVDWYNSSLGLVACRLMDLSAPMIFGAWVLVHSEARIC